MKLLAIESSCDETGRRRGGGWKKDAFQYHASRE